MESLHATGAALVLEDGNIAWPEGRAGAYAVRMPLRWKRRQIGELVCDRDTPFSGDDEALLEAIAHHAAVALEHGRAVMRGVLAQEIHHRVKNNLQAVASLLRLQARAENVDPHKALHDSVNRILAIAAVHEVLTEHREDDVDLGELVDRLRAMLVQGLVAGKEVTASLARVSLAGQQATALALVFTELFQNALEHGGATVSIALAQRDGEVVLTISDDGEGISGDGSGTGLSIVRALVRDELRGEPRAAERSRSPRRGRVPRVTRVLIAEDETIIRLDLRGLLESAGFEVCAEARDGEEAVRLASETLPDVALLDVKMPNVDGIEAARRILDERPIPIVMVTAYGERELVSRAVEAGVFGYLVKPFRETDLLPAIETARARHEELVALREEAESLAEALAARKAIERAKGILMQREGLSEDEAFARPAQGQSDLREAASGRRRCAHRDARGGRAGGLAEARPRCLRCEQPLLFAPPVELAPEPGRSDHQREWRGDDRDRERDDAFPDEDVERLVQRAVEARRHGNRPEDAGRDDRHLDRGHPSLGTRRGGVAPQLPELAAQRLQAGFELSTGRCVERFAFEAGGHERDLRPNRPLPRSSVSSDACRSSMVTCCETIRPSAESWTIASCTFATGIRRVNAALPSSPVETFALTT